MKRIIIDDIEYELKPIRSVKSADTVEIKDYEILSFKNNVGVIIPYTNSLVHLYSYPIYSVKRLSDNEVFTIGDKVSSTWGTQVIEGFIIANDNTITVEFSTCRNPLTKIKKLKTGLFTTEDGKEIFEGDEWWMVREEGAHTNEWEVVPIDGKKPIRCKAAFSTEEKANEFVIHNKPCLSYQDILNWMEPIYISSERWLTLRYLVKNKIRGK